MSSKGTKDEIEKTESPTSLVTGRLPLCGLVGESRTIRDAPA